MYRQFNIQQFHVLPTQCIYVFCVDLRTNSDNFTIQHWLTCFYNRDEVCLLRGTDCVSLQNVNSLSPSTDVRQNGFYLSEEHSSWNEQNKLTTTWKTHNNCACTCQVLTISNIKISVWCHKYFHYLGVRSPSLFSCQTPNCHVCPHWTRYSDKQQVLHNTYCKSA